MTLPGGRSHIVFAKHTIPFSKTGLNRDNTIAVFKISELAQSWVPDGTSNAFDGFERGERYLLDLRQPLDIQRWAVTSFIPAGYGPILCVFTGESNPGGFALNSQLASAALLPRPLVQILNNTNLNFEDLHIGVNNKLGHIDHEDSWYTTHGWEAQLATRMEDGTFGESPCYLVKTPQGTTKIANWAVGATFTGSQSGTTISPWSVMQQRVNAALDILKEQTGKNPQIYIFYSQGINDAIAGTSVTTWKAATKAHIAKIRSTFQDYGICPFAITKLPSLYDTFNVAIEQICQEVPNCFWLPVSDLTMRDQNHWDTNGMNTLADRMMDVLLENYIV